MVVDGNRVELVLNLKYIYLWTQSIKCKLVWSSKTGLERRAYHQFQFDPCVFYRKYSVILTCVDDCVIVSYKKDTITSLIGSLSNGPEDYVLKYEVDVSNYLGFNIKNNSVETFELSSF